MQILGDRHEEINDLGKKLVCNMANNSIGYRVVTVKPRERLFGSLSIGIASQC